MGYRVRLSGQKFLLLANKVGLWSIPPFVKRLKWECHSSKWWNKPANGNMANVVKVQHCDYLDWLQETGVWGHVHEWEVYDFHAKQWMPFDLESPVVWWCQMPFGTLPRPYLNDQSLEDIAQKHAEQLPVDATLYFVEETHVFAAIKRKMEKK